MRKYYLFALLGMLFFAACKKTSVSTEDTTMVEKLSSVQIDAFIKQTIESKHKFEWSSADDQMLWSALQESDKIMSVGYKPADVSLNSIKLEEININDAAWKAARRQVIDLIINEEKKSGKDVSEATIIQWEENVLPVIDITVEQFSTVEENDLND
mgnify:FL=1